MPAAAAVPQSPANMGAIKTAQANMLDSPPPPFSGAPNSTQPPQVTAGQGQPTPQAPPALSPQAAGGVASPQAPQQGQQGSSDGSFQRPDGSTDWEVGSGPKYDWGGMSARTGRAPTSPPPPEADSVDPTRGSAWRQAQAAHDAWIQSQLKAGLSLADLGFSPTRGGGLSIYMKYGGPGGLGEQLQQQGGGAGGAAPGAPTTPGAPSTVGIPSGEPGSAQPAPPMLAANAPGQANQGGLLADPGQPQQSPMNVNLGGANANQGLQQALMQLLMSQQGAQGLQGGGGGYQGASGSMNPNDILAQLYGSNPGGIYQGTMNPQ